MSTQHAQENLFYVVCYLGSVLLTNTVQVLLFLYTWYEHKRVSALIQTFTVFTYYLRCYTCYKQYFLNKICQLFLLVKLLFVAKVQLLMSLSDVDLHYFTIKIWELLFIYIYHVYSDICAFNNVRVIFLSIGMEWFADTNDVDASNAICHWMAFNNGQNPYQIVISYKRPLHDNVKQFKPGVLLHVQNVERKTNMIYSSRRQPLNYRKLR